MKKTQNIIIIIGLFFSLKTHSQCEPAGLIQDFVVSVLRDDTTMAFKYANKDSIYTYFYSNHSILDKDSIGKKSIFFWYRLSFFGTTNILFIPNDSIKAEPVYIKRSYFEIVRSNNNYLITKYRFALVNGNKVRLEVKMYYRDGCWNISSIKNPKLKLR